MREGYVPRPRLIDCLAAGLTHKLTLVSAPAGFGKTTALGAWIDRERQRGRVAFGWLSLDREDSNPVRYWATFIHALQTVIPHVGAGALAMLESNEGTPLHAILTSLLNEVDACKRPIVLVLDDFHRIDASTIHEGMIFLVEHQPPHFHLVLATRIDPPWPIARLRAQRGLLELRQDDLRFTREEAADFLRHSMGLDLLQEDVDALDAHTEGWIAGLQMAALSLQHQADTRGFVAAFGDSDRYIFDYLLEEVLQKQPLTVQEFLLRTAILNRVSAPLCDEMLERGDSREVLDYLERANLFLTPLAGAPLAAGGMRWFRYHALFARLLQNHGRRLGLDYGLYHRRAGSWLEAHDLPAEALGHVLEAGAFEQAARIAEENALAMLDQGQLGTLASWLDALPKAMAQARPWLCVARGWVAVYAGKLETTEHWTSRAEAALSSSVRNLGEAEAMRIAGHVAAIRAYAAGLGGDQEHIAPLARAALTGLPTEDHPGRAIAYTMLAAGLRHSGEIDEAEVALRQAVAAGMHRPGHQATILARCNLAGLHLSQGKLAQARREYAEIIQDVGEANVASPMIGLAYLAISRILREQNELDIAIEVVRQGLTTSQAWGHGEFILSGYVDLAEVLLAQGDAAGALEAIAQAKQWGDDLAWPPWLTALEVKMRLASGGLAAVLAWERTFVPSGDPIPPIEVALHLSLARVWMAAHRWADAEALLARTEAIFPDTEMGGRRIEALVLHALAQQGHGRRDRAGTALEKALALGARQGFVRAFLDEGPPIVELLRSVPLDSPQRAYARHLLAEYARTDAHRYPATAASPVELLTEREIEVLRLLGTTMDSYEIAAHLTIAVTTVRTHIRNIYAKLGVNRRMEAVQRGMELGIISGWENPKGLAQSPPQDT